MSNASDAQLTRIEKSMADNELFTDHWDRLWKICRMARLHAQDPTDGAPLDPAKATEIITWMTAKGWVPKRQQGTQRPERKPYPKIPEGRYATDSRTGNQPTDFWLVEVPAEGKWAGYSFVSRILGGHSPTKIRGPEARAALEAIERAGPEQARDRFADEMDTCWKCGVGLTNDLSRQVHIGPDCCKNVYGMTQTQRLAMLAGAAR